MAEPFTTAPEAVPQAVHEFNLTLTPEDFTYAVYGVSGFFALLALLNIRKIYKFGANVIKKSNGGY